MVGTWGSVRADWTILFALLIGWYLLIKRWERNGTLDRWNATRALGIVLMGEDTAWPEITGAYGSSSSILESLW